ncbi:hypothetical protein ACSBR1_025832 [Camellia fascicularis]
MKILMVIFIVATAERKMKILMLKTVFLIFLFAFLGTQARTISEHEHPRDKLMKNNCGRTSSPTTVSLASASSSSSSSSQLLLRFSLIWILIVGLDSMYLLDYTMFMDSYFL